MRSEFCFVFFITLVEHSSTVLQEQNEYPFNPDLSNSFNKFKYIDLTSSPSYSESDNYSDTQPRTRYDKGTRFTGVVGGVYHPCLQ